MAANTALQGYSDHVIWTGGLGSGIDPNIKPKLGGDSSVEAVTEVLKDILLDTSVIHDVLKAGEVPESEKKEIALDAEVKHRELLAALMSGFGGGEGEKKKGGLLSLLKRVFLFLKNKYWTSINDN